MGALAHPVVVPRGFGVHHPKDSGLSDAALRVLRPAWWTNGKWDRLGEAGYIPVLAEVRFGYEFGRALAAARRDFRNLWFLGDSPERNGPTVEEFLAATRAWSDIGVRMAAPGCDVTTPAGREYLVSLAMRGLIPDFWSIKIHKQKTWMRWGIQWEWVKGWMGEFSRGRPVIVYQTCNDESSTALERVELVRKLATLSEQSKLLRAVGWYCTRKPLAGEREGKPWGWLFDEEAKLTEAGMAVRDVRLEALEAAPA